MTDALTVARIYVRGRFETMWPWVVLAISLVVNVAIFAGGQDIPVRESGGMLSLFLALPFAVLQGWKQMLPFVVGLSATRASFLGGSLLFFGGQAVVAGVLLSALGRVEQATDGWGIRMEFFQPWFIGDLNAAGRFALLASLFLLAGAIGAVVAAVRTRWGSMGVWVASIGASTGLGFLAAGIVWTGWWAQVMAQLGAHGILTLGVWAGLTAAVTLLVTTWAIVRRVPVH